MLLFVFTPTSLYLPLPACDRASQPVFAPPSLHFPLPACICPCQPVLAPVSLTQHAGRALVELRHITRRPPLLQVSVLVKLSAAVIEAVRDLVPYYHADAAVVEGAREGGVVERGLKDAGGEHWRGGEREGDALKEEGNDAGREREREKED